ncbi:hypothetical protein TI03_00310 [Achromatium sp. WMS1]|nr:hypothetical protein TI03_00310 [Achromatium sp. WMS1]
MLILSGDIGATKAHFALITATADTFQKPAVHNEVILSSADFDNAQKLVSRVINIMGKRPDAVSLGVAGPVHDQCCQGTNIPWRINSHELKKELDLPIVYIINDLEAIACGIPTLTATDVYELHQGKPNPTGNIAVIAAGTGLGEAGICQHNANFYSFPSEGGHTDFAPANAKEWALLEFLSNRYGHVSWERVISGLGIPNILDFLCQYHKLLPTASVQDCSIIKDRTACICAAADTRSCSLCIETMAMFVSIYGREAGNYALKIMATGGVYLAGGVSTKILPHLQLPEFLSAFFAKGRLQSVMHDIPVRVILNNQVALFGAAIAALRHYKFI